MAYVGQLGKRTRLPYAVLPVESTSRAALVSFLSQPRRIAVLVVEDDADALERLDAGEYDIVVLDVMLPRVSGDEVFRHLQATRPLLRHDRRGGVGTP